MTEEKTCYNCGNKNCHIFYFSVKQDVAEHHETYEYTEFDCVKHDKWKEMKVEEIRTDNTETLKNALTALEKENAELKEKLGDAQMQKAGKTKWHKVVDGDLPKENNLYLVAIKDNGLAIAYFNGLHWETKFNLGDFGHCLETVIAWCEIPKFEEK